MSTLPTDHDLSPYTVARYVASLHRPQYVLLRTGGALLVTDSIDRLLAAIPTSGPSTSCQIQQDDVGILHIHITNLFDEKDYFVFNATPELECTLALRTLKLTN